MMRSLLLGSCVAVAAAAEQAPAGDSFQGAASPLFTIGSAIDFTCRSVVLGKDLVSYATSSTLKLAYEQIPPPQQDMLSQTFNDAYKQVENLRSANGVPSYSEVGNIVSNAYENQLKPQVVEGVKQLRKALFPMQQIVGALVSSFEKSVPQHEGLLPKDILDLAFVLFFLTMLGMYFVLPLFTGILCCGMCTKRNTGDVTPRKPNGKTDLKTKKKQ